MPGWVRTKASGKRDDPLILGAKATEPGHHKVHKKGSRSYMDASVTWHHKTSGVVTDVVKTKKGITVLVKAASPMQIGDKLSGRYGDKGVISDIVPDEQMPHSSDGKPFEVLLNPLGLISHEGNFGDPMPHIVGRIRDQARSQHEAQGQSAPRDTLLRRPLQLEKVFDHRRDSRPRIVAEGPHGDKRPGLSLRPG